MPLTVVIVQAQTSEPEGKPDQAARNHDMRPNLTADLTLPAWLPDAVRLYLDHTEDGVSLRALARREGRHASTVMRQVRRYEARRDDPPGG